MLKAYPLFTETLTTNISLWQLGWQQKMFPWTTTEMHKLPRINMPTAYETRRRRIKVFQPLSKLSNQD